LKRLILTADDFGSSVSVNKAVEKAHREGILTTASLMVGGAAASDAIERAKNLPFLRVGLHLVLVDGVSVLPPGRIPGMADGQGQFSEHLFRSGLKFFFRGDVRKELHEEIRAQFMAFCGTGLPLDHVNTHHHIHLHPTVLNAILTVGRSFSMYAVRLPHEPLLPSLHVSSTEFLQRLAMSLILAPWMNLLRNRIRRAGLRFNRFIFGLHDNGKMSVHVLSRILKRLPQGDTEIYFHPALEASRGEPGGGGAGELEALTSPQIRDQLEALRIQRIGFRDL
jgi:chitin disaccharide deacetylase